MSFVCQGAATEHRTDHCQLLHHAVYTRPEHVHHAPRMRDQVTAIRETGAAHVLSEQLTRHCRVARQDESSQMHSLSTPS